MKRNTHCIVPEADFRLLQGAEDLSCYQVGRAGRLSSAAAQGQLEHCSGIGGPGH